MVSLILILLPISNAGAAAAPFLPIATVSHRRPSPPAPTRAGRLASLVTEKKPLVPTAARVFSGAWWWYHVRVGMAGGLAGAVGTTLLHPVDCAKTVRQANPQEFSSVQQALRSLITKGPFGRIYAGVIPAAVGAFPSSALYFGAYESMKSLLLVQQQRTSTVDESTFVSRLWVHAAAAASGNILSSAIFVPKEFVKQQLQYQGGSLVTVIRTAGIRGLYRGYQATLMRNIPTAALRFVLYEELKWRLYTRPTQQEEQQPSWKLFAAGAVAGALASGLMTPVDVLKTRLVTGSCPIDSTVQTCFHYVLDTSGWGALYAGAGSRMFFSGAFSAVGFGTFELAKRWLGVSSRVTEKAER